ncbi:hypothetical protein BCR44DRAFT_24867 [Catenaria anguillulae PL171]|uniref:Uncharacterized protein n=1 Tax=Catenaria anguillulae PL171 TaxID=765915 RepID=A0A1Y2H557_9FUNG|nr:hypothetical protein BCR44DRAFT_24867 [Catenaria anguillulae PL171]
MRDVGLFPLAYAEGVLDAAAGAGQLKVLNWSYAKSRNDVAKRERLHFKYSHKAVGVASAGGHLNVLDWFWVKSNEQDPAKRLRLKKTVRTVSWADHAHGWPDASSGGRNRVHVVTVAHWFDCIFWWNSSGPDPSLMYMMGILLCRAAFLLMLHVLSFTIHFAILSIPKHRPDPCRSFEVQNDGDTDVRQAHSLDIGVGSSGETTAS